MADLSKGSLPPLGEGTLDLGCGTRSTGAVPKVGTRGVTGCG